jgi:hypothetical protein
MRRMRVRQTWGLGAATGVNKSHCRRAGLLLTVFRQHSFQGVLPGFAPGFSFRKNGFASTGASGVRPCRPSRQEGDIPPGLFLAGSRRPSNRGRCSRRRIRGSMIFRSSSQSRSSHYAVPNAVSFSQIGPSIPILGLQSDRSGGGRRIRHKDQPQF